MSAPVCLTSSSLIDVCPVKVLGKVFILIRQFSGTLVIARIYVTKTEFKQLTSSAFQDKVNDYVTNIQCPESLSKDFKTIEENPVEDDVEILNGTDSSYAGMYDDLYRDSNPTAAQKKAWYTVPVTGSGGVEVVVKPKNDDKISDPREVTISLHSSHDHSYGEINFTEYEWLSLRDLRMNLVRWRPEDW